MVRYQPQHKEATRRRLVDSAVTVFRRDGVDTAALADIMRELGLTVGGFYRHFPSKSALLQSALARGLEQSLEHMRQKPGEGGLESIERFSRLYLSAAHRQSVADGCVLAALGSDIVRGDADVKAACETGLQRVHAELLRRLPEGAVELADQVWALLAMEVGGLLLSRMVADERLAEEILSSCRKTVTALLASAVAQREPALKRAHRSKHKAPTAARNKSRPKARSRKKTAP
jgi:AcrR family transcriptional regulator